MEKYNTYLIVFYAWDESEFMLRIRQDINRPNNPDDDELIEDYIMNNYGGVSFRTTRIEDIDTIDI